jgi:hypothetical protein
MAKNRRVISTFHGGMVTNKAKRDLDAHESIEIIGLSTMTVGSLTSANVPAKIDTDTWDADGSRNMVTGYGFFTFESDWDLNSNGAAPNEAATTIICWHNEDSADTFIRFVDQEDHSGGGTSTITWTDHDGYPNFYAVNGSVRVSDANLSNTANTPKWFGICPQKFQDGYYFGGSGVARQWRQMDNNLLPPGACLSSTSGTVTPTSNASIQDGEGFGLQLTKTSGQTEGKWASGVYEFAGSNLYLENQESKLTTFNNTLTIADADRNEFIEPVLWTSLPSSSGLSNAARQTGGRIYYRRNNRSWKLFLDFSYEHGCRTSLDDDYTSWAANGGGYECGSATNLQVKEPYPITYESLNGHRSGDVTALSFGSSAAYGYKTSVIAQSRAWVANVAYPDEGGTLKTMGDRILYSPPNKYDTFPNTYWLDIGANDGENFTALIEHSGFLFAFKENTLYIINIQSPVESGWRVQNKLHHYGIKAPYAVCKTKDGIYWVNGEGVYLWQGGQIKEISLKVSPGISSDLGDNSIIGYDVVNREIYIRADGSGTNAVVWVFHTPTQSWYKDTLHSDFARLQSNFDHNARNIRWMLEDGSSDQFLIGRNTHTAASTDNNSTTFSLQTKDMGFGNLGVKKKVYGFTINYKTGETGNVIQYRYALDGGAAVIAVNFPTVSADSPPQRIQFTTPLICQSFSLYILTSSTNSIVIRDISIEYRLLNASKVS